MDDNCSAFCGWEARWNPRGYWMAFCPTHQEWTVRLPDSPFPWYEGEKLPGPGATTGRN